MPRGLQCLIDAGRVRQKQWVGTSLTTYDQPNSTILYSTIIIILSNMAEATVVSVKITAIMHSTM